MSTKGDRKHGFWCIAALVVGAAMFVLPGASRTAAKEPAAAADPKAVTPAPVPLKPGVTHVLDPASDDLSHPEDLVRALGLQGTTQLTAEALAFHQSGLDAVRSGDAERAAAHFTWAAALDASFPEPHLALARMYLLRHPVLAARHLWRACLASISSFESQHTLALNLALGLSLVVFLGGFLLLAYVALTALPRGHHSVMELIRRWVPGRIAPWFAGLLLLTPLGWRIGLIPLACLLAGFLMPWSRPVARRWTAAWAGFVVAAPLLAWALSPLLFAPLDPGGRPFLLSRAMISPHAPGLEASLRDLIGRHPEDGNAWFALALCQERGRSPEAWASYQKALELGGPEWQTRNNLGVLAFGAGRVEEAVALLEQAAAVAPEEPAPHFNLSQVYARKLYFEKADQELALANELDFGRIRVALRNQKAGDVQALLDETLPASAMWKAAWASPRRMPGVSPELAYLIPGSAWVLAPAALLFFGLGLGLSVRLLRILPTKGCINCGRPICRRCHRRIRRDAYCAPCGDLLLSAENVAYSRLILDSRLRRYRSLGTVLSHTATWALPGFHAARKERLTVAAVLCFLAMWGAYGLAHPGALVNRLGWLPETRDPWWPLFPVFLLVVAAGLSLLSVFKLHAAAPPAALVPSPHDRGGNVDDAPDSEAEAA